MNPSKKHMKGESHQARVQKVWLTYEQAAEYCGWSVVYLRNLVNKGQIPVYGRPRVRRFLPAMLDLYLADPSAAMRKFHAERRNKHGS